MQRYQEVVEAYFTGLEQRIHRDLPVDGIASVASFFVSRVDSKVDRLLRKRADESGSNQLRDIAESLLGRTAIANSKLAFHFFTQLHSGPRWEQLRAAGARPQRCLWASTSVKDPGAPPTRYVEALVGPQTVNTMPLGTLKELGGANISAATLEDEVELVRDELARLAVVGINLETVTAELETEGLESFRASYQHLLDAISDKVAKDDPVSLAGEHSFPASDPPGYGGGTPGGPPSEG